MMNDVKGLATLYINTENVQFDTKKNNPDKNRFGTQNLISSHH